MIINFDFRNMLGFKNPVVLHVHFISRKKQNNFYKLSHPVSRYIHKERHHLNERISKQDHIEKDFVGRSESLINLGIPTWRNSPHVDLQESLSGQEHKFSAYFIPL